MANVKFPLKSTDSTLKGAFVCWFYPTWIPGETDDAVIYSKWDQVGPKYCIRIFLNNSSLKVNWGHTNGTSYETFISGIPWVTSNRWYFLGVSFDGKQKSLDTYLFEEATGKEYLNSFIPTIQLSATTADFVLGSETGGLNAYDGYIDEFVAFKTPQNTTKLRMTRKGAFTPSTELIALSITDLLSLAYSLKSPTVTASGGPSVGFSRGISIDLGLSL